MAGGRLRLICGLTGGLTLVCFLLLPIPSEMASFWIGCSNGNFQPSNTCTRMCTMIAAGTIHNFTSCCYGVNHAGRTACACCADTRNCPTNCASNCVMVSINCENCGGGNVFGDVVKEADVVSGGTSILDGFFSTEYDLIPVPPERQCASSCKSMDKI